MEDELDDTLDEFKKTGRSIIFRMIPAFWCERHYLVSKGASADTLNLINATAKETIDMIAFIFDIDEA